MEISLWFLLLGALGFGAYEVGVRIIDEEIAWTKRIGILKYLLYLVIFGGATSFVAGVFAYSFIPLRPLAHAFAVLFGLGMPATIRISAEVITKLVFAKAKKSLGDVSSNSSDPSQGPKIEHMHSNEIRQVRPKYHPMAYIIGDIFGFAGRL